MAKTYNTIGLVSAGDPLTETIWNEQAQNVNNYRVAPAARVYRTAALSHASTGNYVAVAWDTQDYDTDDLWASSPNQTRMTPTTAGIYLFTFQYQIASNATGVRLADIYLNGSTAIGVTFTPASGATNPRASVSAVYAMNGTTDYVEFRVFQDSTTTLAYTVGAGNLYASATWQGQVA